jgi:hypothetical protein
MKIEEMSEWGRLKFYINSNYRQYKSFILGSIQKARHTMDGCEDNFRVYKIGDKEMYEIFLKQRSKGCCGVYEEEISHKDGTKFVIGFNYGH